MEVAHAPLFHLPSTGISIFCLFILLLLYGSAGKQCENCGSTPIPHPLSISPGCGDPNYSIFCDQSKGDLFLRSEGGGNYPITSIHPPSQTFILRPAELIENSCRTSDFRDSGIRLNGRFKLTTNNTIFLLNCTTEMTTINVYDCATQSSISSSCWTYLKKGPPEVATCRSWSVCCTRTAAARAQLPYDILLKVCTAYKSYVNLNMALPIQEWKEGIEVQWDSPSELECRKWWRCHKVWYIATVTGKTAKLFSIYLWLSFFIT